MCSTPPTARRSPRPAREPSQHSTPSTTCRPCPPSCAPRRAPHPKPSPPDRQARQPQPTRRENMSTARDVTDATFEAEVLNSDKTILVDFWAEWCGPCRAVSPILDQIAAENADKIEIVKLNVDDNPQTAMKYQITSIPAMKVYKGGEVAKTVIGAMPKPALEAQLAEFLA